MLTATRTPQRELLFQALLFLSGAGALLYQVVWQRVLTQIIGVDEIAIVFIVAIFMMGLGAGAYVGSKVTNGDQSRLPVIYMLLEIGTAVYGALSLWLLRWVNASFAGFGLDSIFVEFCINALLLFTPIFLMGITTPVAIQLLKDRFENFGKSIGRFYGANVVGAAFGAFCSFIVIELLNLNGTIAIAIALNITVGTGLFVLFRSQARLNIWRKTAASGGYSDKCSNQPKSYRELSSRTLVFVAFCFGFVNLAIQIVSFRLLINYSSPLSYLFSIGLSAYLITMALGQSYGGYYVDRLNVYQIRRFVGYIALGIAISFVILTNIPYTWLDALRPQFYVWRLEYVFLFGLPLAFLFMAPTFFASAYLPILTRLRAKRIEDAGAAFGTILFASTLGNILGVFFVGLFLFDLIGAIQSITFLLIILLLGLWQLNHFIDNSVKPDDDNVQSVEINAVQLSWTERLLGYETVSKLTDTKAVALAFFLSVILIPNDYFAQPFGYKRHFTTGFGSSTPIATIEGRSGITSVYHNKYMPYRFETRPANSGAAAALAHNGAVFYKFYSLAALRAIDPAFQPKKVLQIGMGSGEFPFVMKELEVVEQFDIVELVPEVVEAYERFSDPMIAATVNHPKVNFHVTDGRRFIQKAFERGEKYDFIQVGVTGLASSGVSNMYTTELFEKIRQMINPGGYVALEPYASHARLLFEFFPQGIMFEGSSWLFMQSESRILKEGTVSVNEPHYRTFVAMTLNEMRTPRAIGRCEPVEIGYAFARRGKIIPRFNWMLGTDDHLPLEYWYLRQYLSDFIHPAKHISRIDGILEPFRKVMVNSSC